MKNRIVDDFRDIPQNRSQDDGQLELRRTPRGRSAASLAEHAAIVETVSAGDATGAELAMRAHLFNVADAVQRGRLPGGIDSASRGVLEGSTP